MAPKRKKAQKKRGKKKEDLSDYDSDEELYDEHPEDREMSVEEALAMIEEHKREKERETKKGYTAVYNGYGKIVGFIPSDTNERNVTTIQATTATVTTTPPRTPDRNRVANKKKEEKLLCAPPRIPASYFKTL